MASLTIRLSEVEKARLERLAAAVGLSVSAYVRRVLLGADPDLQERLAELEKRVGTIERMAGM